MHLNKKNDGETTWNQGVKAPMPQNSHDTNDLRLRHILLNSPGIFLILKGRDLIIDFVNEALLKSWNKDWDILGQPLAAVLPELKTQANLRILSDVFSTGKPYVAYEEKTLLHHNGTAREVYYNYVAQPVLDVNGAVTSLIVMATDITEQVETRRRIAESELRFRALVTATSDVVYRMSPDWKEMRELQGRGFLSDTGEPNKEWLAQYILPKDRARLDAAIKHAIDTKTIFEMEHQVLQADGSLGWTFSRAVPIFDASGNITEWFGAASNITSRKLAEEALEKAREAAESRERLYDTITSNTPDLVYVFDTNYKFVYANKALLTMWGKSWEEAIGKGLPENGYDDWHAEMHQREIDTVIATKKPIRGEVSFPHSVLGKRIYDYIFVPVLNNDGEVEAIAGTTRDITDLKLAEEKIRESEASLQRTVDNRTKELARSNEDLQQFAHVASHDLKEPVRKITTFTNLLKDRFNDELPDQVQYYLTKIEHSAIRIYRMIDGILQYSSLNNANQEWTVVDLNEIINDIQSDLELLIETKQATIEAASLPKMQGSFILLHQLFYNLINNALKFSSTDRLPVIRITAESPTAEEIAQLQLPAGKDFHKVVISDNGIGFDEKQAPLIFQAFSRLHAKDQYEGTGLGLSLCKNIVERHAGAIYAKGKDNEGATFVIIIPV